MLAAGHHKIKRAAWFLASTRLCYHGLSRANLSAANIQMVNVLLISTYELGRQPFGLAEPAAWLERAGAKVSCLDLSRDELGEGAVGHADMVAFYIPMHTATRLAVAALPKVRRLNPRAKLAFYGLYAPVNEPYLRSLGAEIIVGGEFEEGLTRAVEGLAVGADLPFDFAQGHEPIERRVRSWRAHPDSSGRPYPMFPSSRSPARNSSSPIARACLGPPATPSSCFRTARRKSWARRRRAAGVSTTAATAPSFPYTTAIFE